MSTSASISGLEAVLDRLASLGDNVKRDAARGATIGAHRVLAKADEDAPLDTGRMVNESDVIPATDDSAAVVVFPTPYAERQEEDDSLNHPNGGKAHFLRDALESTHDEVVEDIADAIAEGFL